MIERFIKVLTEKQETIVADVLKRHPYPSDFQMLSGEVKNSGSNGLIKSLYLGLTMVNTT